MAKMTTDADEQVPAEEAQAWVEEGVRQYMEVLETSDPASIAVVLAIWQANHAQFLANSRAIDELNLPISVTGSRLAVLRALYFSPGKCMALSNIGRAANISLTMVTNLIDALARAGYVRRAGSPDDRRVSLAYLTPEGEEAFLRVLPVLSQRMTDACVGFTEEEKQTLLRLLQRLY